MGNSLLVLRPSMHAPSHRVGGSDPLAASDLGLDNLLNVASDSLHGVHSGLTQNSFSFSDETHILTLLHAHVYYYKGARVSVNANNSIDLDDYTLTSGLWFIYYDDTSGILKASKTSWDLWEVIPIATVYWTGTASATNVEHHNENRNIAWHIHHHTLYGADYYSGFDMVAPSVASFSTININSGTIYDEDLRFDALVSLTNCRLWYQTGENTITFINSDRAHLWSGTAVQYINASTYAPTSLTGGQRCNTWIYGTSDWTRPLQVVVDTLTSPYNNTALARAAQWPRLTVFGLSNEWKLFYRVIWGASSFIEFTDYRQDSPKPAGGVNNVSAASVSLTPFGDVTASNIQAALQQIVDSGFSLPSTPVVGERYRLTADDDVEKASPGIYTYDGTGWTCETCFASYNLGNSGATPTLNLISGVRYTLTQDQEITSCAITISKPGTVCITKTGEFDFAVPTMEGRTIIRRTSDGWTSAGSAYSEIVLFDNGTQLWISAVEGIV